jgi:hypothetical protein
MLSIPEYDMTATPIQVITNKDLAQLKRNVRENSKGAHAGRGCDGQSRRPPERRGPSGRIVLTLPNFLAAHFG